MKRKLSVLVLIYVILSLLFGCAHEVPEFLPGENEGDGNFVWVCEKPFGFFFLTDDHDGFYAPMKGYIEGEGGFTCFYSEYVRINGFTYFGEPEIWKVPPEYESFWAYADHDENYFDLEIGGDHINFFGGELPTLRFNKMAKESFLEQYGDIENVSELLE